MFALNRLAECVKTCEEGLIIAHETSLEKLLQIASEKLIEETKLLEIKFKNMNNEKKELKKVLDSRFISYSMKFSVDIEKQHKPQFILSDGKIVTSLMIYYPEFQQMDFVMTANEDDYLFELIWGVTEQGLPWDVKKQYVNPESLRFFVMLEKREMFTGTQSKQVHQCLSEIDVNKTILEILQTPDYVVPGHLEIYMLSIESIFYKHFLETYK